MMDCFEQAWEQRVGLRAQLETQKTDAYRLFGGSREGLPGVVVDQYGEWIMIRIQQGVVLLSPEEVRALAETYLRLGQYRGAYVRFDQSDRSSKTAEPICFDPQPLLGEAAPAEFEVFENGLRYAVRLYDGYLTGFFLDQREHRQF